jgi:hypothetical protein
LRNSKKDIPDVLYAAWVELDRGQKLLSQGKTEEGNKAILAASKVFVNREQVDILQPIFDKTKQAFRNVSPFVGAGQPVPGMQPFVGDYSNQKMRLEWTIETMRYWSVYQSPGMKRTSVMVFIDARIEEGKAVK